jgi:uncharacterized protein (UPF0332 family)
MRESFLNRAEENLEAANILFDLGLYNASANRFYYSCFHIAIAYLFSKGFEPTIDHQSALSLFINEFINKKKTFSSILKNSIYEMQNIRNYADYKSGVSKNSINKQKKLAKYFFNEVYKEL